MNDLNAPDQDLHMIIHNGSINVQIEPNPEVMVTAEYMIPKNDLIRNNLTMEEVENIIRKELAQSIVSSVAKKIEVITEDNPMLDGIKSYTRLYVFTKKELQEFINDINLIINNHGKHY